MNSSFMNSTFYTTNNSGFQGSFSEKNLSPAKRSLSPVGKRVEFVESGSFAVPGRWIDTTQFEKRVHTIDKKLKTGELGADAKLKSLSEQIAKLEVKIPIELAAIEAIDTKRQKEIKDIEAALAAEVHKERIRSKQAKGNIMRKIEERTAAIRTDVAVEQRKTGTSMDTQHEKIEKQINVLQNGLDNEIRAREANNEKLIKKVAGSITKIQETMNLERKMRLETENMFLRTMDDLNRRLTKQVKAEVDHREKSEEEMLRLLEESCLKLEVHYANKSKKSKWVF